MSSRSQAVYGSINFCTKCHGGLDNATGAPPLDVAGNTEPSRRTVGAHSAHVEEGAIARALACAECHPDTQDVCSTLHLNLLVDLEFGATARSHGVTATYDAPTCTNWCHGAGLDGGTNTEPSWTATGSGQASCGTCHGIPPTMPSARHPSVLNTKCVLCHPETMTLDYMARDILIPGGSKHVNGAVEAEGHDEGWYDPTARYGGRHGANMANFAGPLYQDDYYASCPKCHGDRGTFTVDGGWTGISCGKCHAAFFITEQPVGNKCGGFTTVPCVSCIFCHN